MPRRAKNRILSENPEIAQISRAIKEFFDQDASHIQDGKKLGGLFGVYAFFDFRGKPMYIGRSVESLRSRVGRHLTNQRTDAVAMGVLDPAEVTKIKVWPLHTDTPVIELAKAEYAVFQLLTHGGEFVFNEQEIPNKGEIDLPRDSPEVDIISGELLASRSRLDVRIARRIQTLNRLSGTINDRELRGSSGLRQVVHKQTLRLIELTKESANENFERRPVENENESTGDTEN